jgi:ring-1,2-phenylacetyl-CoA epoxidase subunit PaaE
VVSIDISVGVKKVETGKMSSFLCNELKEGDNLEVMPPTGNFVLDSTKKTHIVGICAGSGITPIFSMIKTILLNNDNSNFTLIYGNKTMDSSMFAEELKAFQEVNPDRFKIHWAFSQEKMVNTINGRLDKDNIQQLLHTFPDLKSADAYFLCGPGDLIDQTNELLLLNQVAQNNIHFERFTTTKKEEETYHIIYPAHKRDQLLVTLGREVTCEHFWDPQELETTTSNHEVTLETHVLLSSQIH